MKTNNPIIGYGLIVTSCAWATAAVIIGFRYQQKSFLLTSLLAVLALLSVVSGVIIVSRLEGQPNLPATDHSQKDASVASLIHISALIGYLIPLANILLPFWLWRKHQHKSKFIYQAGLEAVNFQLTCGVYFLSAFMLCALFIGFVILPVIVIYQLIFTLVATYTSAKNNNYCYPGNLSFIHNKLESPST